MRALQRIGSRLERPPPRPLICSGLGSSATPSGNEGKAVHPKWAPAPLLRKRQRTSPPLGWPRQTDSLCPECTKEARAKVLSGAQDLEAFIAANPGEIRAQNHRARRPRADGQRLPAARQLRRRDEHRSGVSVAHRKAVSGGRDYESPKHKLRDHGTSTIKYGRGSVLTVDLTNRCNMMCDPCFMDANQVGFVHELGWEEVQRILDDSLGIKPRRQLSVQFSGGEPTLSPHFLRAIKYARDVGYFCVQCASNGIRFAQEPEFCTKPSAPVLRLCYLQFDGVTNEANSHRKVGNLYDVKLRAIREFGRRRHRRSARGHGRERCEQRPSRADRAICHRQR